MATKNNRIVVDLSKVQWAAFYYRNQSGQLSAKLPAFSVHGRHIDKDEMAFYHPTYPVETMRARAIRLGIKDVWTPELKLKLTASEFLIYTGEKAKSIYKEFCAKQFKKTKKS